MPHGPDPMLATIVACVLLAFLLGSGARMLRLPALVGYIAAGILIGPSLPGAVAERGMVTAMAEVGVALLLFGVGLHFRTADLLAVWRVAVPGAVLQIALAMALGAAVGIGLLGLGTGPALAFGLALAISSTAVATKTLEEHGRLGGEAGRLALGWLVMQDLVVVFALVLLPALAQDSVPGGADDHLVADIGRAAASLAAFALLMGVVGRRALPWALVRVARGGSRELFTLAVLAAALGVAVLASALFGVSFALGAFFAGVVLGESDVGHQAAAEATPLARIFSAIFFVSVGLLLDLSTAIEEPAADIAALLVVLVGIGGGALLLLLVLGVPPRIALVVAGGIGQIGEFSFLLTEVAIGQGLLPAVVRGPVLVAAVGSIMATPLLLKAALALAPWLEARLARAVPPPPIAAPPLPWPVFEQHAVVVGAGRVGAVVIGALRRHHLPLIVVEADRGIAESLLAQGIPAVWGDATRPEVMHAAAPERARIVIVALPGAMEAREVLRLARAAKPDILAVVRTHSDEDTVWLHAQIAGSGLVVMGERETALGMADYAMQRLGVAASTAQATVDVLRTRPMQDIAGL
jgi:CPA2 family monovalent cation:H+ antiporter-2